MNLKPDLLLNLSANWLDDLLLQSFKDFPLIVINNLIRLLSMLHIPQHLKWIIDSHQKVVELIRPLHISHNHVKNEWEK
jgi:hypothetical protein